MPREQGLYANVMLCERSPFRTAARTFTKRGEFSDRGGSPLHGAVLRLLG